MMSRNELSTVDFQYEQVGVVIPCFNNLDVLKNSLPAIYHEKLQIIIFDDGSTDGTSKWVKDTFPKISILKGDGNNWWTGSLAKGIDECLSRKCNYILSLNADVIMKSSNLNELIRTSKSYDNAIVASIVVDKIHPENIVWSGSTFQKIHDFIPIMSSKYIFKSGTKLSTLPKMPYKVDEVHGRGVLFPSMVFDMLGNYDFRNFPHYGGDTDFSWRAKKRGISMLVNPNSIVEVFLDNTSLNKKFSGSLFQKLISIYNYFFVRKYGEAILVWWKLYKKHLPLKYLFQSYAFVISLNLYRRFMR